MRTGVTFGRRGRRDRVRLTTFPCSSIRSSGIGMRRDSLGTGCSRVGTHFGRPMRDESVGFVSIRIRTSGTSHTTLGGRFTRCRARLTTTTSPARLVHGSTSAMTCLNVPIDGRTLPSSVTSTVSSVTMNTASTMGTGTSSGALGVVGLVDGRRLPSSVRCHIVRITTTSRTRTGAGTSSVRDTLTTNTSFRTLTGGCNRANRGT